MAKFRLFAPLFLLSLPHLNVFAKKKKGKEQSPEERQLMKELNRELLDLIADDSLETWNPEDDTNTNSIYLEGKDGDSKVLNGDLVKRCLATSEAKAAEKFALKVKKLFLTDKLSKKSMKQIFDSKETDGSSQGPAMKATLYGKSAIMKIIFLDETLSKYVNFTLPEKDGYTPFHGAGFQGRAYIAHLLAEKRADKEHCYAMCAETLDLNRPHIDSYVPLHRSCWGNADRHAKTLEAMVEAGATINAEHKPTGNTCREMTRNPATVKMLDYLEEKEEL